MLLRASTADQRLKPVENLATNPRFERVVTGTTVVRRNLATFPQGQNTGAGIAGWLTRGSGANSAITRLSNQTDGPLPQITGYIRRSFTATQPVNDSGFDNSQYPAPLAVTVGRTYTYSAWLRTSINGVRLRLRVQHMTGPNVGAGLTLSTMSPNSVANQWTRLSVTFTATHPFVQLIATSENGGPVSAYAAGDTIDGTGLLLEERPGLLPYFDGATTDVSGISYTWESTAGASMSIARAATTEIRRNLKVIPAIASSHGVSVPIGSPTSTITTNTPLGTPQAWRMTHDGSAGNIGFDSHASQDPAISITGTAYSFSAWIRLSKAATITVTPINAAAVGATGVSNPAVAVAADTWTRIGYTATINNTGGLGMRLRSSGGTYVAGDTLDVGAILVESAPIIHTYFDGSNTPDANLTPVWSGTQNASTSTLQGISSYRVETGNTLSTNYRALMQNGLAVTGISSVGDTSARVAGSRTSLSGGTVTFEAGKTYTVTAELTVPAVQTGYLDTRARSITVESANSAAYTILAQSTQSANSAGTYRHRVVFTVPNDAIYCQVRCYSGAILQPSYWSKVTISEGVYNGPYLDGNTPGVAWRGTPHSSPSIGYAPSV